MEPDRARGGLQKKRSPAGGDSNPPTTPTRMWRGTHLLNPKPPNLVAQAAPSRLSTRQAGENLPRRPRTEQGNHGGCRVHSGNGPPPHPRPAPGGPVTRVTCQPGDAVGNALPCLPRHLPCLGALPVAARHSPERAVTLRSVSLAASQRPIMD